MIFSVNTIYLFNRYVEKIKIVPACLVLFLLLLLIPVVATANPIEIFNWADLDEVRDDLEADYILMNNLDRATAGYQDFAGTEANNGAGWEPIGDADNRFSGSFNGQFYTISDLYINRPNSINQGLFGHVGDDSDSTTIENIKLKNPQVIGDRGVGSLIGRVTGNSNTLIKRCAAVDGAVEGTGATGGLIGSSNSFQTSPGGDENPFVRYSFSEIDVTYTGGGGGDKFGGLVGCSQKGTIENSYASGTVSVDGAERVGGLAGCIDLRGKVVNSYSVGLVDVTNSLDVGGLVGNLEGPGQNIGTVENSFWDTETSGQSDSAGGTGRTTSEMQDIETFSDAGWDIAEVDEVDGEIWQINSGQSYPLLTEAVIFLTPAVIDIFNGKALIEELDTGVELSWFYADTEIQKFRIYRHTENDPDAASQLDTLPVDGQNHNFLDSSVERGNKYYYWVTAVDSSGLESDFSSVTNAPYIELTNSIIGSSYFRPGETVSYEITYVNTGFGSAEELLIENYLAALDFLDFQDKVVFSQAASFEVTEGPTPVTEYLIDNIYQTEFGGAAKAVRWSFADSLAPQAPGTVAGRLFFYIKIP